MNLELSTTFKFSLMNVLMAAHQVWLETQEYSWPESIHDRFKRVMAASLTECSPLLDILWITSLDNQLE